MEDRKTLGWVSGWSAVALMTGTVCPGSSRLFLRMLCLVSALTAVGSANANAIPITDIRISNGWARGDQYYAMDGNLNTFSYLTYKFCTGVQTAYLDLGSPATVNGFELSPIALLI